jgi:hypothetical protein
MRCPARAGLDDRQARRLVGDEHAEEVGAAPHDRLGELNLRGDAVNAVSNRIPRRHAKLERAGDESAICDEILNVLVFGPVDLPKQREIGEGETPKLRRVTHVSEATPRHKTP